MLALEHERRVGGSEYAPDESSASTSDAAAAAGVATATRRGSARFARDDRGATTFDLMKELEKAREIGAPAI